MNTARMFAMGLLVVALAALFLWQNQRDALVMDCTHRGGLWDGKRCVPAPGAPMIERDLRRS